MVSRRARPDRAGPDRLRRGGPPGRGVQRCDGQALRDRHRPDQLPGQPVGGPGCGRGGREALRVRLQLQRVWRGGRRHAAFGNQRHRPAHRLRSLQDRHRDRPGGDGHRHGHHRAALCHRLRRLAAAAPGPGAQRLRCRRGGQRQGRGAVRRHAVASADPCARHVARHRMGDPAPGRHRRPLSVRQCRIGALERAGPRSGPCRGRGHSHRGSDHFHQRPGRQSLVPGGLFAVRKTRARPPADRDAGGHHRRTARRTAAHRVLRPQFPPVRLHPPAHPGRPGRQRPAAAGLARARAAAAA